MRRQLSAFFGNDLEQAAFAEPTHELDPAALARLQSLGYLGGGVNARAAAERPHPKDMMPIQRRVFTAWELEKTEGLAESTKALEKIVDDYPFVHGARDNGSFNLAEENITLAEIFKAAGWATHGEVAAIVLDGRYGLAQGFDTFGDVERKPEEGLKTQPFAELWDRDALEESTGPDIQPERPMGETERKADEITRRGIELLTAKAQANERFFMFLHYFDPHWPHEAPERFASKLPDGYLAEIAFFDEQFGKLMDALGDLGLSDRTLVVLTADHGEGRREHGEDTHSMFLYDSTLRVPLIMWFPGQIPAGQVVQERVRLIDLAPTILDFVELERTDQMQGTSLLPFIADPTLEMRLLCYSDTMVPQNALNYSPLRSLRVDGWKYILSPRSELYHLAEDGKEVFNLVQIEAQRAARMKDELREIIVQSPEPIAGRGEVRALDEDESRKLAALGYLGSNLEYVDRSTNELDHFEPVGISPRDRMEVVQCWASGLGAFHAGQFEIAEKAYRRFLELEPASALAASFLGKCLLQGHGPQLPSKMSKSFTPTSPVLSKSARQSPFFGHGPQVPSKKSRSFTPTSPLLSKSAGHGGQGLSLQLVPSPW
jgi:arylsulfatase A-like enzyme